jgi:hypothetical protein
VGVPGQACRLREALVSPELVNPPVAIVSTQILEVSVPGCLLALREIKANQCSTQPFYTLQRLRRKNCNLNGTRKKRASHLPASAQPGKAQYCTVLVSEHSRASPGSPSTTPAHSSTTCAEVSGTLPRLPQCLGSGTVCTAALILHTVLPTPHRTHSKSFCANACLPGSKVHVLARWYR